MKKIVYISIISTLFFSYSCSQKPSSFNESNHRSNYRLINELITITKSNFILPYDLGNGIQWIDIINEDDINIVTIYYIKDISIIPTLPSREESIQKIKEDAGMTNMIQEGVNFIYRYYINEGDSLIKEDSYNLTDID